MKTHNKPYGTLLVIMLAFALTACGVGAGGSGGIDYTGVTTSASLADNNTATTIVESAYQGGVSGTSLNSLASLAPSSDTSNSTAIRPGTILIADAISGAFAALPIDASVASGAKALGSGTYTLADDCSGSGGYLTYSINLNFGLSFTATMHFYSFCSKGVTIDGSASAVGTFDFIGNITSLTVSYPSLTISNGTTSFTSSGDIDYSYAGTIATVVMNTVLRDDATTKLYRTENLAMTLDEAVSSYVDVSITGGNFYHEDYGYVTVTTPTALRFFTGEEWPRSGSLLATGSGGATALLTVLSNTQYQVDVDNDGNPGVDYTASPLLWANL